jgi:hypothetical protein
VDPEAMPKLIAEGMNRMNSNTAWWSDLVSLLLPFGEGDPHLAIVIESVKTEISLHSTQKSKPWMPQRPQPRWRRPQPHPR